MSTLTKTKNFNSIGIAFMPRDKTAEQQKNTLIQKVIRMRIGDSFFVPDATRVDMEFLRRPVLRAGCGIRMVQVNLDDIYQQPGVRVWREEGEFDDL